LIEVDESFRHNVHLVQHWEATVDESRPGWFELDMGIVVDGTRLPLAPLLATLFKRDRRWLDARQLAAIDDEESIDMLADDGRTIRAQAGRIKPLATTLIELFGAVGSGPLRLSRFDAPRLDELANLKDWNLSGMQSVRDMAQKLQASRMLTGAHSQAEPPLGLAHPLRPYQLEGVAWLQFLREHSLAGIVADDMGLGKTAQALAHVLLEKEAGRLDRPVLVVLPTSLVFNWKNEAARWTPSLTVLSLHGLNRHSVFAEIPQHDLVLTTYPLLWRDLEQLAKHKYHLLILDEAQTVKNAQTRAATAARKLNARHRLCLTGTPLENHLGELWSQFDFLLPGFLGDARSFAKFWRTPIEKQGDAVRSERLRARIRPFILRRRKDEVAQELPPKTVIVRSVELVGAQRDLYETVRSAMDQRVRDAIARQGLARSSIVILDALLKLRQVCCDPRLLKTTSAQGVTERAKLELLMDMLPALIEEGRRILVFSQFTEMLALIEIELQAASIDYVQLTGQTRDREAVVKRFQTGDVPLFLISLKAGGVGLNLTAADVVIHYDPWWNPAVENQATDRAHRLGQDKAVFVYKLVVAGSIEERILALQERKALLADEVLSDARSGEPKFDEQDLVALLEPLADIPR
jgi:SNF2 family DNA or RNA helicase